MDDQDTDKLTQEEIDEYREAFGMFDINGDGASLHIPETVDDSLFAVLGFVVCACVRACVPWWEEAGLCKDQVLI